MNTEKEREFLNFNVNKFKTDCFNSEYNNIIKLSIALCLLICTDIFCMIFLLPVILGQVGTILIMLIFFVVRGLLKNIRTYRRYYNICRNMTIEICEYNKYEHGKPVIVITQHTNASLYVTNIKSLTGVEIKRNIVKITGDIEKTSRPFHTSHIFNHSNTSDSEQLNYIYLYNAFDNIERIKDLL